MRIEKMSISLEVETRITKRDARFTLLSALIGKSSAIASEMSNCVALITMSHFSVAVSICMRHFRVRYQFFICVPRAQ